MLPGSRGPHRVAPVRGAGRATACAAAAVNVLARSDAAYTERDNLRTPRTVIETSAQRADSAIWRPR